MKRTAKRVLVSGSILPVQALLFAGVLAVIGFYSLAAYTNILTTLLGVLAYIWYIAIYGLAKRTTAYSTIIGGLAGALPPVAGYVSMVGHIDSAAIILFILMQVWQMPHFYAIALFRAKEYKAAKLPIWSVTHGLRKTKQQILIYIVLFVFTAPLLGIYGYIGNVAVVMLTAVAAYWLVRAVKTYNKLNDDAWARSMFGVSLIVLLVMSAMIGVGGYLP